MVDLKTLELVLRGGGSSFCFLVLLPQSSQVPSPAPSPRTVHFWAPLPLSKPVLISP